MQESAWKLFDRIAADYDQVAPFFAEYGAAIVAALDPTGRAPSLAGHLDALFARYAAYLPPGGSMGRPVDAAELLDRAGFVDLREDRAGVAVTFPDNATLWEWALSHGYRAFIDDLPEDRRREFRDRVMDLPADDRVLRRATGIWSGRKPG